MTTAPDLEPYVITLTLELRVRPDRIDPELFAAMKEEAEYAGFPPTDENAAWYLAEDIAAFHAAPGLRIEIIP